MKLTKKSYNRRIYAFGIMVFIAIALVSTGFASWVMSNNAVNNPDGTISVGQITDGSIVFDEVKFKNDVKEFKFEPAQNDTTGMIKSDVSNPDVYENLSVTLIGSISPAQYFAKLTVNLVELPVGIVNAISKNYIVAPECYNHATPVTNTNTDSGKVTFEYTISFQWGDAFKHTDGEVYNPSIFLDLPNAKEDALAEGGYRDFTYQEKLDTIVDLRRTIYNLPEAPSAEEDTDATYTDKEVMSYTTNSSNELKYKVELVAYANL